MKKLSFRLLFRIVLVAFTIYAAFNLISLRADIASKEAELTQLKKDINSQTLENQALQDNIKEELTAEEIASIARNKLGYTLPGERLFIDVTGQ